MSAPVAGLQPLSACGCLKPRCFSCNMCQNFHCVCGVLNAAPQRKRRLHLSVDEFVRLFKEDLSSVVGLRVDIYWPLEKDWFSALIAGASHAWLAATPRSAFQAGCRSRKERTPFAPSRAGQIPTFSGPLAQPNIYAFHPLSHHTPLSLHCPPPPQSHFPTFPLFLLH